MPEFAPGEQKTALVPMSNPTAKPFDYYARIYMGMELVTMSEVAFHLEAGESKSVRMPITMPQRVGTYPMYIGVFSNDQFIEPLYQVEDIVIASPIPAGQFTVKAINYDNLLARVEASWKRLPPEGMYLLPPEQWLPEEEWPLVQTLSDAQWFAEIPSKNYYAGWPFRYLYPSDGKTWRPLSESCPFLIPEGSEFWNPYPYVEIWIGAGPCCYGSSPVMSWSDATCRSFGIITWRKVAIIPGGEIVFDLSNW